MYFQYFTCLPRLEPLACFFAAPSSSVIALFDDPSVSVACAMASEFWSSTV